MDNTTYKRWVSGIVIGDFIALIPLVLIANATTDWNTWANVIIVGLVGIATITGVILQVLTAGQMTVIMDRQEIEITKQRKAAEDALAKTDTIIERDRQAFYLANRAYIGTVGAFIEPEGMGSIDAIQHFAVPDGRFRFVVGLQNKGNTPALNVGHVFRYGIQSPPIVDEPPDFQHISESRTIGQILPNEAPHWIRGSWMEFESPVIKAINSGTASMILSSKFVFDTLGEREDFVVHFLWLPGDNVFTTRRDYPFTHADDAFSVCEDKSTYNG